MATSLFGLAVSVMIAFMIYQCYLTWLGDQEAAPSKLAQAPIGCVADRLRNEARLSAKPLTNRAVDTISQQCETEASEDLNRVKADEKLKEQRGALGT